MLTLESGRYFGARLRDRRIGGFHVTESRYRPLEQLPQHAHDDHVLIVTVAGSRIDETARSGSINCPTGSVQFHPANIPHAHRFGPTDSIVLNITLSRESCEPFARFTEDRATRDTHSPLQESWLATRMLTESILADAHSDLALHELVAEFFAQAGGAPLTLEENRPRWLDEVLEQLDEGAADNLSLAEISRQAGRNAAHVARSFRRWQGCSIGEYLRRRQLARTVEDLASSAESISAIAMQHGFSDQAHLTRVLRGVLGVTPGQIRRRGRS